jgi:hypothetical protein
MILKCIKDIKGFTKGRSYNPIDLNIILDAFGRIPRMKYGFSYSAFIIDDYGKSVGVCTEQGFEWDEKTIEPLFGFTELSWIKNGTSHVGSHHH